MTVLKKCYIVLLHLFYIGYEETFDKKLLEGTCVEGGVLGVKVGQTI